MVECPISTLEIQLQDPWDDGRLWYAFKNSKSKHSTVFKSIVKTLYILKLIDRPPPSPIVMVGVFYNDRQTN